MNSELHGSKHFPQFALNFFVYLYNFDFLLSLINTKI
jgi:hypothetical protein